MKDETRGVAIEVFVELKPKIYLFFIDDTSEQEKANGLNKKVVTTITPNEYKDVLLNNKCLMYSMTRILSKSHRIGTYEIDKFQCIVLMTKYISKTVDITD